MEASKILNLYFLSVSYISKYFGYSWNFIIVGGTNCFIDKNIFFQEAINLQIKTIKTFIKILFVSDEYSSWIKLEFTMNHHKFIFKIKVYEGQCSSFLSYPQDDNDAVYKTVFLWLYHYNHNYSIISKNNFIIIKYKNI